MIYSISGKIIAKNANSAVLETAGIGFKISILSELASALRTGGKVRLYCFLYPESFELYGFFKNSQKEFFEMLIGVSGIGPKNALKIMNSLNVSEIKTAVASEDLRTLKDSGMSVKTASKIILELKDKIEKEDIGYGKKKTNIAEVKEALRSLGYSKKQVDDVVSQIPASAKTIEEKVKSALKILARR